MKRFFSFITAAAIICMILGCSQNGSDEETSGRESNGSGTAEESYDPGSLSGAWILESDASQARYYLITDGRENILDSSLPGCSQGTYSVQSNGTFVLGAGSDELIGWMSLASSGSLTMDFERLGRWHAIRVSDLSVCSGTWQGSIRDSLLDMTYPVIILVDDQGAIKSVQGFEDPVTGRILSSSGKVAAFIDSGNSNLRVGFKAGLRVNVMTGSVFGYGTQLETGSLELRRVVYTMDNAVELLLDHYGVKKGLIINGDDLAMGHFANDGIFAAWDAGAITSMSLFTVTFPYTSGGEPVPSAPFAEAVDGIRKRKGIDVGCHLTLNSTDKFLVRPVLPPEEIPHLVDENGFLKENRIAFLFAPEEEIKAECRAQIDKALDSGVELSHLDCHVGWGHFPGWPRDVYAEIADEYRLPLRWVIHLPGEKALTDNRVLTPINFVILDDSNVTAVDDELVAERKQSLLRALRSLPDGITEVLIHPSREQYDDQAWRILDYRIITDPEVRAEIDSMRVSGELALLGFNDLKKAMQILE